MMEDWINATKIREIYWAGFETSDETGNFDSDRTLHLWWFVYPKKVSKSVKVKPDVCVL